jgi:hypothetical protein
MKTIILYAIENTQMAQITQTDLNKDILKINIYHRHSPTGKENKL